jgi:hypothetical protein
MVWPRLRQRNRTLTSYCCIKKRYPGARKNTMAMVVKIIVGRKIIPLLSMTAFKATSPNVVTPPTVPIRASPQESAAQPARGRVRT